MRLLLDSSIWSLVADELRQAGYDVESVANWPHDPGDRRILAYAHRHRRILVTLDKDFGDLIVHRRLPHAGLVRLVPQSVQEQTWRILQALQTHGDDLLAGAIVTVEEDRIRVRPPEA